MQAFKREELVGVALQLLVAGLVAQPGLGVGVGYLDQGAGIEVRAELGLVEKDWKLRLAVPVRYLLTPDPSCARAVGWLIDFRRCSSRSSGCGQFELREVAWSFLRGMAASSCIERAASTVQRLACPGLALCVSPSVALDRVTDRLGLFAPALRAQGAR